VALGLLQFSACHPDANCRGIAMADAIEVFHKVVAPCFPQDADFTRAADNAIAICWKLNDPARPSRRSRPVVLVFSDDLMLGYADATRDARQLAESELQSFIGDLLLAYEPAAPRDPAYVLYLDKQQAKL
jgi:hypothetical protein